MNGKQFIGADEGDSVADFVNRIEEKTGKSLNSIHLRQLVHEPGMAKDEDAFENVISLSFFPASEEVKKQDRKPIPLREYRRITLEITPDDKISMVVGFPGKNGWLRYESFPFFDFVQALTNRSAFKRVFVDALKCKTS